MYIQERGWGLTHPLSQFLQVMQTNEEIIGEYPDLTKEQIVACLDYARELSEFEVAVQ